ncbi:DUF116 domain-containing protein [Methanocaldococcus sp.]
MTNLEDENLDLGGVLQLIGVITIVLLTLAFLSFLLILIIGFILLKKNKLIFPNLALFLMDNLYSVLLKIFLLVGTEDTFYRVGIEFYNKYYEDKFKKAKKRVLVLPHCLRDVKCPAKLTPKGVECVFCNRCGVGEILKVAESKGYKVYIIPGSTFLKRILKEEMPEAVFGVACNRDLFYGMNSLSRKGIPSQGQPLLRDGCINTIVDMEELISRLKSL